MDFDDMAREQGGEAIRAALRGAQPARNRDASDVFLEEGPEGVKRMLDAARYPDGVKPKKKPAYLSGLSAAALAVMTFEPIRYIVPGYIVEGLTILAGAPKIGKSWMALMFGMAVAAARPAFGSIAVDQGDVLYLALEDNARRLRKRLVHMNQGMPERITFMTEWPTMDEGCVDEMEAWVHAVDKPRLIIVDVLAKVRGATRNTEATYDADYRAVAGMQKLAGKYGIAIIVVHHTRKMDAEDPFDSVSGTRGVTGAADTVLVLKRDIGTSRPGQATLYGRGRDIEEIETAVLFIRDNGTWRIVGAAHEVGKTDERQAILDVLRDTGKSLTARQISDLLDANYENVRKTLTRMAAKDQVQRDKRGLYSSPNGPIVPSDPIEPADWDIGTDGTGGHASDDGLTAADMDGL